MGSPLTEERHLYAALNNCAFVSTKDMLSGRSGTAPSQPFTFLMDASMLGSVECRRGRALRPSQLTSARRWPAWSVRLRVGRVGVGFDTEAAYDGGVPSPTAIVRGVDSSRAPVVYTIPDSREGARPWPVPPRSVVHQRSRGCWRRTCTRSDARLGRVRAPAAGQLLLRHGRGAL